MTGKQHITGLRLFIYVAVALTLIVAGIELYHFETSPPRLEITSVSFKVNYIGNNTNYLDPGLIDKYTGGPTDNVSQADPLYLHESGGKWEFALVTTMGFNHSNPIFNNILTNPVSENNSVVIKSIDLSTNAFSFAGNQSESGETVVPPFPYVPTLNGFVVLPFILNAESFVGPLTLTLNAESPAPVLVAHLHANVSHGTDHVTNVSLNDNFSINTYSYLSSSHIYIPGQTLDVRGIVLESRSNFTVSGAEVNAPFSISMESLGSVQRNSNGYFAITMGVDISTPSYFYNGDVNITIIVESM